MKRLYITGSILFFALIAFSQYRTEIVHLDVNGLERYYHVYIPKSYSLNQKYPLVFILHGGGGTAKGMVRFVGHRFNKLADNEGFIAIYPNGFKKGWNDGARDTLAVARRLNIDDVVFFDAMITDLEQKLSINKTQIFACGISNGGFMVQRLAFERPEIFKAIAVVAANLSEDQSMKIPPENPVSVLFICGTSDPLVPYNGGHVTLLKQKRGKVKSTKETVEYWKKINGCSARDSEFQFPDVNQHDKSTAVKTTWYNPDQPDLKVINIKIENGGHTWPGEKQYLPKALIGNVNRDFDACDEIWRFFKTQR